METQPLEIDGAAQATRPVSLRTRLSTLAVILVTGAVILTVAFLSNQPAATTSSGGAVTSITLNGAASGGATHGRQDGAGLRRDDDGRHAAPPERPEGQGGLADVRGELVSAMSGREPGHPGGVPQYKDQGLVVVQVYITEDAKTVVDYADRAGLTYTKIPDQNERIAAQYRILGIPSHFFIDKAGVLRQLRIGSFDPAAIETAVTAILQ